MTGPETSPRAELAARLRDARTLAGLSQSQVAKMLGLHRPTISEMEAGNRKVTAEELVRLSEIYDVSVSWLLGELPDGTDADNPRVQLAARELAKLKPDDLDRLLKLLNAMRASDPTTDSGVVP